MLDLLAKRPGIEVVVVADPRPDAPGVIRAGVLGIPVIHDDTGIYEHNAEIVIEVTGNPRVLERLVARKPAAVELIGALSVRFVWDLIQEREESNRGLAAFNAISSALATPLQASGVLHVALEKVLEVVEADFGAVFQSEPTSALTPVAWKHLLPGVLERYPVAKSGAHLHGQVAATGEPILIDVADGHRAEGGTAQTEQIRSLIGIPLNVRDRLVGVLVVGRRREPGLTRAHQDLLMGVSSQLAVAIDNIRLHQTITDKASRLTSLVEITKRIAALTEPSRLLSWIVKEAVKFLDADAAGIRVVEGQELVYGSYYGYEPGEATEGVLIGETLSGKIVRENCPLAISDISTDDQLLPEHRDAFLSHGFRSYIGVPTRVGDSVLGVLFLLQKTPKVFSPGEVETLFSFADQAAIAIQNARLYEETRQRAEAEAALNSIAEATSQSLELDRLLQITLDRVLEIMGRELGAIKLREGDGDEVTLKAHRGLSEPYAQWLSRQRHLGAEGLQVLSTGAPLTLNPPDREQFTEMEAREGIQACACVPLKANAKVLGIMNVATRRSIPFKPRELELLTAIGNMIGVAVQNAQLFVEVKRSYEELQRTQGQLIQAEKLTALGQMAGGVAHDFNNILAAILGRTQLLIRQVEDPQVKNWLRVIERAALDGAETVRRIQGFTRQHSDEEPEAVDLNELVDDVVKITEVRWKDDAQAKGIRFDVHAEAGTIPPVIGNPSELREVLINVVLNALDAMPNGGRLGIGTGVVSASEVEVTISDTGLGMSEEIRHRIFDPFFTTKGPRSTGLGMSVAYGIIHRHSGEILVESKEGHGSTFRIRLPVGEEEMAAPASPVALPSQVKMKILVIDDEDGVREALRDMLRSTGSEVEICRNAREGLCAFDRDHFDIVFTDLGMPDISGWQVAEAVKAKNPETPVVLVTGWGVQIGHPDPAHSAVDIVLSKPFRVDDALQALGRAIELRAEKRAARP